MLDNEILECCTFTWKVPLTKDKGDTNCHKVPLSRRRESG